MSLTFFLMTAWNLHNFERFSCHSICIVVEFTTDFGSFFFAMSSFQLCNFILAAPGIVKFTISCATEMAQVHAAPPTRHDSVNKLSYHIHLFMLHQNCQVGQKKKNIDEERICKQNSQLKGCITTLCDSLPHSLYQKSVWLKEARVSS